MESEVQNECFVESMKWNVFGVSIDYSRGSICQSCGKHSLAFLYDLKNTDNDFTFTCGACASAATNDAQFINCLDNLLLEIYMLRDNHLRHLNWSSKSMLESDFYCLFLPDSDDDTETHFLDTSPCRVSYSVYYQSRGRCWIAYENTAKSICGYRHKNDCSSIRLPGDYASRDEAKLAVYDYRYKKRIANCIKAYNKGFVFDSYDLIYK